MAKSVYSRREFVKIMAVGGAALIIPGCGLFQTKQYVPNLGIQLYTVRKPSSWILNLPSKRSLRRVMPE